MRKQLYSILAMAGLMASMEQQAGMAAHPMAFARKAAVRQTPSGGEGKKRIGRVYGPGRNQRKRRKLIRQNPHLLRGKKYKRYA